MPRRCRSRCRCCAAAGFRNISLDLIFALPEALGRDWARDLDLALALEPEHLSLYGLTVEEGTPLGRWTARGESTPPPDERYAAEYLLAHQALRAAGFEHYEVSNAGRPGYRARHNSAYWRRAPFIGLGPSAHSALAGRRSWNVPRMGQLRAPDSKAGQPIRGGGGAEREPAAARGSSTWGSAPRTASRRAWSPRPRVRDWVANGWAEVSDGRSPAHRRGLAPARRAGPIDRLSMSLALPALALRPNLSDRPAGPVRLAVSASPDPTQPRKLLS